MTNQDSMKAPKSSYGVYNGTRITSMIVLMVLSPFLAYAHTHSSKNKTILCEIRDLLRGIESELACQNSISFGNADINQPGGFVINQPGKYCLMEDAYEGTAQVAVTINAPNVYIDLNQFTLSGNGIGTRGILVNSSNNVVIQNGAVENFTINGIAFYSTTNIVLDNLLVFQNGNVTAPIYGGGLAIFDSSHINMNDVHLRANFGFGLGMSGIDTANFINSSADATQGANNTSSQFGNTAYAIFVSSSAGDPFINPSRNMNFFNCTFNNTTGQDAAFALAIDSLTTNGMAPQPNTNVVIENCTANNTSQTAASVAFGPFVEGFTIAVGNGVTIRNCTVDGLSAVAQGGIASHLVGIEVAASSQAIIEGCSVANVTGSANYVHGFDIEGSGNDITFRNDTAYNITNKSTAAFEPFAPNPLALGFGILKPINLPPYDGVSKGIVVQNCIAQNVHATNVTNATAAGILVNAQQNVVIENCISNNNDNGILVAVVTPPGLPTTSALIRNNVTNGNTYYGINDSTASTSNAYYANTSQANGAGNYFGLPLNTPVVDWVIGFAPTAVEGVLDNYSITPL